MLTPARPSKGDPGYQEKMKQFHLDTEDKRQNPRNWGMVHGDGANPSPPPRRGRPHKSGG